MDQGNKEKPCSEAPDAARQVGRLVGLGVGVTVGIATATCGLVAGVPAPDLVLRAVCVGVAFRVVAGWCGSGFTRSLLRKPDGTAAPPPRPEGDR
jgi:hypothetical protein